MAEWFALFLLGVQSIVVTSTPAWIQLHVQLLLLASHLIVARLLCLVQCVPLTHTHTVTYRTTHTHTHTHTHTSSNAASGEQFVHSYIFNA